MTNAERRRANPLPREAIAMLQPDPRAAFLERKQRGPIAELANRAAGLLDRFSTPSEEWSIGDSDVYPGTARHYNPLFIQLPQPRNSLVIDGLNLHYAEGDTEPRPFTGVIRIRQHVNAPGTPEGQTLSDEQEERDDRQMFELYVLGPGRERYLSINGGLPTEADPQMGHHTAIAENLVNYAEGLLTDNPVSLTNATYYALERNSLTASERREREESVRELTSRGVDLLDQHAHRLPDTHSDGLDGNEVIRHYEPLIVPLFVPGDEITDQRYLRIRAFNLHEDPAHQIVASRGVIIVDELIPDEDGIQTNELFRLQPGIGQFADANSSDLSAGETDARIFAANGFFDYVEALKEGLIEGEAPPLPPFAE